MYTHPQNRCEMCGQNCPQEHRSRLASGLLTAIAAIATLTGLALPILSEAQTQAKAMAGGAAVHDLDMGDWALIALVGGLLVVAIAWLLARLRTADNEPLTVQPEEPAHGSFDVSLLTSCKTTMSCGFQGLTSQV